MIGATFTIRGELTGARRINPDAEDRDLIPVEVCVYLQGPPTFGESIAVEILVPTCLLHSGLTEKDQELYTRPHQLESFWIEAEGFLGGKSGAPELRCESFRFLGKTSGGKPRPWPTLDQLSERTAWMIGEGPEPEWMR